MIYILQKISNDQEFKDKAVLAEARYNKYKELKQTTRARERRKPARNFTVYSVYLQIDLIDNFLPVFVVSQSITVIF